MQVESIDVLFDNFDIQSEFCGYNNYKFKNWMEEYSIEGEDVSQSPRTQERPQPEQLDFYKVPLSLSRWIMKLSKRDLPNNQNNHILVLHLIMKRNSKAVLSSVVWHTMRSISKSVKNK